MKVIKQERGWAGHFICADKCLFKRNTLLSYKKIKIIVSTVGLMKNKEQFNEIGLDRFYETMAFYADKNDKRYYDIDASREIFFESKWSIAEIDADDRANEMHEIVVKELSLKLKQRIINGD